MKKSYITPEFYIGEQVSREVLLETSYRDGNSGDMGYEQNTDIGWNY